MIDILLYGFLGIIWLYVAARIVTRAIYKTMENRRNNNGKAEK